VRIREVVQVYFYYYLLHQILMQKRNENNSTVVNIKEEEDKIKTKPHWYEKRKVFFQIRNL